MAFSDKLLSWYDENARSLPWRGIDNPYYIWLSEIILQQTRIEQGMDYYLHFISRYPTVFDLANASEEQVLKSWQGLGYYSRARNLLLRLLVPRHPPCALCSLIISSLHCLMKLILLTLGF